jgi:DNA-binding response OmpR family regulator
MQDKFKILVVDDDPDIGTMIKMMLEYKGYAVTVTDRGDNAENLLQSNGYDLMIMDMLLSGINGIDVCSRIKKNEATADVPIMMISAHPNAKEICLQAGADEFISKPFDMEDMFSKIRKFEKGVKEN